MESDDPGTKAFRLPTGTGRPGCHDVSITEATRGEPSSSAGSLSSRWQIERSYEFATPEAALLFVACAVAVAMVKGVWPAVELCRERVHIRLSGEQGPSVQARAAWRELTGWAEKLGAGSRGGGRSVT